MWMSHRCVYSLCVCVCGQGMHSFRHSVSLPCNNDNGRRLVCASSDRKKGFSGRLEEVDDILFVPGSGWRKLENSCCGAKASGEAMVSAQRAPFQQTLNICSEALCKIN